MGEEATPSQLSGSLQGFSGMVDGDLIDEVWGHRPPQRSGGGGFAARIFMDNALPPAQSHGVRPRTKLSSERP
jgi:hypothetical protein